LINVNVRGGNKWLIQKENIPGLGVEKEGPIRKFRLLPWWLVVIVRG